MEEIHVVDPKEWDWGIRAYILFMTYMTMISISSLISQEKDILKAQRQMTNIKDLNKMIMAKKKQKTKS